MNKIRIVIISDTHGLHRSIKVPSGDILIHAGDFCNSGTEMDAVDFAYWFKQYPHPSKIIIAGNHDVIAEKDPKFIEDLFKDIYYLFDSSITIKGLKFYGSPWQPRFNNWAFNINRGSQELKNKWSLIPKDTDVLITHGPPKFILDRTNDNFDAGCEHLRKRVFKIKPKLHIFGHIHEGRGLKEYNLKDTVFINASCCTSDYKPINPAVIVDFENNKVTNIEEFK